MSTIYKFDGKIHIKQIEHMCEKIHTNDDRGIRKGWSEDGAQLWLLLSHSIVHIDGKEETDVSSLIFDVEEDGYISSIGRYGKQNPYLIIRFIHLIEYYTNVKIWDEYDLLDIENWISLNEEYFEDSLDMVS